MSINTSFLKLKYLDLKTYKVCRVQNTVFHWVGQVQREFPHSSFLGFLAKSRPFLFDL